MPEDPRIDSYTSELSLHLRAVDVSRRQAIATEFASRIAAEAAEPGRSVEDVLAALGPAEKLAARYCRAMELQRAQRSYSPVVLLNAALKAGLAGVLSFIVGMLGYWAAGAMLLFGLMGLLWTAVSMNARSVAVVRLPLGTMLVLIVAGCLLLVATTLMLRVALRNVREPKSPLAG